MSNRADRRRFRYLVLRLKPDETTKDVHHYGRVTVALGGRTADRVDRTRRQKLRRTRYEGYDRYEPARMESEPDAA